MRTWDVCDHTEDLPSARGNGEGVAPEGVGQVVLELAGLPKEEGKKLSQLRFLQLGKEKREELTLG